VSVTIMGGKLIRKQPIWFDGSRTRSDGARRCPERRGVEGVLLSGVGQPWQPGRQHDPAGLGLGLWMLAAAGRVVRLPRYLRDTRHPLRPQPRAPTHPRPLPLEQHCSRTLPALRLRAPACPLPRLLGGAWLWGAWIPEGRQIDWHGSAGA
jgi:hypothetical protein